ncbi:DUF4251 domain-containing protein [Dysgonomonas macrotermitis]|uniref:DUF4251 domain-containing protein n=1 Tax=Dysgonomonas macrotermitis TaxID=1346286 RepID=A0A1M5IAZ5_9BACT|nr:DUF4251 domain-containing protein [Dysgonomonas macrotermitis]SHG25558.1 protein of unknown function [Dysgonomonas macrotermitis]
MKKLTFILSVFCLVVLAACKTKALTPEQQAKVDANIEKIESRNFTFTARNATPMSGRSITLTDNYYLKISPDSVQASLPYFGRAYVAPTDARNLGISFVSTDFDYKVEQKKNTSEITIVPKDLSKIQQSGLKLILSLGNSGYGTLSVISTNRQSISFYGTY